MTRAAQRALGGRTGFTLVELLVVLALISLVAGIAVPTIVRVASQNRNALRDTALDLQEVLRATKVMAQTRRLDSAVVYLVNVENGVAFIDGVATARRLSQEELAQAGFRSEDDLRRAIAAKENLSAAWVRDARLMIPVPVRGGDVRPLRGMGGLFDETAMHEPEGGKNHLLSDPASVQQSVGVIPVFLLDRNAYFNPDPGAAREDRLELLRPQRARQDEDGVLDLSFGTAHAFPAHVFQPNGVLLTNSSLQRFELLVAARPSADEFEQWADPWGEDPDFQGDRKRLHYRIELFATMGRVRLGTDLVAGSDS